jgi:hypothetical protein
MLTARFERVLGVQSTSKALYFALVEDGTVLDTPPQKIEMPGGLETGASLASLSTELHRQLALARASAAAILVPNEYGAPSAAIARVGAETVLRLVADEMGLEVELLGRKRARSILGVGQKGQLDAVVKTVLPNSVGKYWSDGRRLAAFGALACEKGSP